MPLATNYWKEKTWLRKNVKNYATRTVLATLFPPQPIWDADCFHHVLKGPIPPNQDLFSKSWLVIKNLNRFNPLSHKTKAENEKSARENEVNMNKSQYSRWVSYVYICNSYNDRCTNIKSTRVHAACMHSRHHRITSGKIRPCLCLICI